MFCVLIADDDPLIQEGLRYIVDWEGMGVEIAGCVSSGDEAISFISTHWVDILLTDIKMPHKDGIELIRWIRENHYDIKCIILSGYDDYKYMQQAVRLNIENYLIKSINENELAETIRAIVEKLENSSLPNADAQNPPLRANVLQRWVNGKIDNSELQERCVLLGIDLSQPAYRVCVLRLFQNAGRPADFREVEAFLAQKLSGLPGAPLFFQSMDADYLFLFSSRDCALDPVSAERFLMPLAKSVQAAFGLAWFLTDGGRVEHYHGVPKSYARAVVLMGYSMMMPDCRMVSAERLKDGGDRVRSMNNQAFEALHSALTAGDYDAAVAFVDTIYNTDYTVDAYTPDYLQNTSLKLLFSLLSTAQYLNLDTTALFSSNDVLYQRISMFRSKKELHEWMVDIILRFFQMRKTGNEISNPLVLRILHYVEKNLAEDFNLKTLAFAFNVNAAYLGRSFKDETGEALSVYLNRLRVEKAKDLLLSSNRTVREVAQCVGYANTNYFINVFKKYTGVFPSQYRAQG